jgi:hypothetical protein
VTDDRFFIKLETISKNSKWTWAAQKEIADIYSIPTAFQGYLNKLKHT